MRSPLRHLQRRAGRQLFEQVSGGSAGRAARERIHTSPGPRWFADDSAIARVHGDASMFVGGVRALLLQSLHPLAMAAVADHSGYRGDPWGRLGRTSTFLAETTFATADDAQRAVDVVRAVHARVAGVAPDGRPYAADDPWLLRWVHVAEVDSFLGAHQRYGRRPLDGAGCDAYLAETATVAERLGADRPPRSRTELRKALDEYRDELAATDASRDVARFLLAEPPLPWTARGPYVLLAAASYGALPRWAQELTPAPWPLRGEPAPVRVGGHLATRAIRWALAGDPPPRRPA
ncbi:oxygenase MpaB family protein [Isoptericola sp. b515]|uniref:oxygenase MpaB family protein n=1 Tax=Isoptericola sp. b515 TaxID=3064652 RepID=UPI0027142818|nr:oxygenase MpaB family protein [Isoptericola sp. b515]MDO8148672.1 oxygenase MpaB family protein [Isoptericola sp. b515]